MTVRRACKACSLALIMKKTECHRSIQNKTIHVLGQAGIGLAAVWNKNSFATWVESKHKTGLLLKRMKPNSLPPSCNKKDDKDQASASVWDEKATVAALNVLKDELTVKVGATKQHFAVDEAFDSVKVRA